jgi:mannosyltransferase OCH1-like enzyme
LIYLEKVNENKNNFWKYIYTSIYIHKSTGNSIFTDTVYNYKGSKRILSYKYLEPCETKYKCVLTDKAYMLDKLGNHWMNPLDNAIIMIYSYKKIIGIILFYFILFYFILFYFILL